MKQQDEQFGAPWGAKLLETRGIGHVQSAPGTVLPALKFKQRFPLLHLIFERCLFSIILLIAVSMLIFGGVEALPGDFATTYLGQSATPQAVANIRTELGLDRPLITRYFEWLGGALQGDFYSVAPAMLASIGIAPHPTP